MAESSAVPGPEAAAMALLARIYSHEIDADLLAALRVAELRAGLAAFDPGVDDVLGADWGPDAYEAAASEFCALFLLPDGVAPLASAWLPGNDPNRAAGLAALTHALRAHQELDVPDVLGRLPDDHVSVILALGSWLAADAEIRHELETFLETALLPWLPAFATALLERTCHPVYTAAARATLALCEREGGRRVEDDAAARAR